MMGEQEKKWVLALTKLLVGRTVVEVGFIPASEVEEDWSERPFYITFDDGHSIYPMQDEEGNGPGALGTTHEDMGIIPPFPR